MTRRFILFLVLLILYAGNAWALTAEVDASVTFRKALSIIEQEDIKEDSTQKDVGETIDTGCEIFKTTSLSQNNSKEIEIVCQ